MEAAQTGSLPVAGLRFDGSCWERDADELEDAVLARLVRRRLRMERMQGWIMLALMVVLSSIGLAVGAHLRSTVFLFAVATLAASSGVCLGFFGDRAMLALFSSDARAARLTSPSASDCSTALPARASSSRPCARSAVSPSDADLARFVR